MVKYKTRKSPTGAVLRFPDSMSNSEIQKVMDEHYPQEKGWLGIGKDIYKSGKTFLPEFWQALQQLPSEIGGVGKNPERIPQNLLAGLAQGGAGLLNTPANIRDYLAQKDIISQESPSLRIPESILPREYDYAKGVGLEGQLPGDVLTQGLGSAATYALGGELGALGVPARIAARSGAQALHAVGQNQDPLHAAASIPAFEIPLRVGAAGANALRPTNRLRGNLTPEELQANVRAAEGTNTALGDIIGSPTLKQIFENMTTKWPGSGSDELLARMGQQVENRAEELLNQSGQGLGPAERNAQLKTALEEAYESQRIAKNELYEPVNQLAQQEGFTLELPSFRERAIEQMENIANSPFMRYDQKLRQEFQKLANKTNAAGEGPSIADTNMMASKLYEEGQNLLNRATSAEDRSLGRLYTDLAQRARNDIRNELETRASPDLQNAYETATNNYRENFSQFLDRDIYKLTQPGVEAESIINDVIKPGKKGDKYSRIEKIQNALPPEQRGILGNAWLRNALDKEGTLNPKQFARLINELGPRQFEALFPDPIYRQQLLDYGRLRGMNEKALSRMANPNTGQTAAVPAMLGAQFTGAFNAASHGNLPGAAAWMLGPQVGSRIMNQLLTSPNVRANFVERLLQNEQRPLNAYRQTVLPTLLSSATKEPFMTLQSGEELYD